MAKPVNGTYVFHVGGPPAFDVHYTIDDAGVHTTFGVLVWSAEDDMYRLGSIALRFVDSTHFVGLNGNNGYGGTYATE